MAHQTNNPVPVADYTGRQDPGKGYLNEYDVLQRDLENLGIFPVAPGFGSALSELGDMILYSSTGRSGAIDRVNNLDRYASLPATWIGQAAQEFGGLLSMTPEELMQLRRSINALVSNDPSAREDLWEGVKEAGRNYQSDPMAVAEDFGGGVPGVAIAAPKVAGKLLQGLGGSGGGDGGGKVKGAEHIPHKPRQGFAGVVGEDLEPDMSMVTPPEAQYVLDTATGTRKSLPEIVDPDEWSDAGMQEFLDADVVPENWNPGDSKGLTSEGYVEGENVDPLMVKKSDLDKSKDEVDWEASDSDVDPTTLSDTELDQEILNTNMTINAITKGTFDTDFDFQALLEKLVEERHKRKWRKNKGGGGSAGAKKQMSQLDQMKAEGAPEPDAGWPVAHGIEGFTGDADFGSNITNLLGNAKFSTKRNQWIFPDVGAGTSGTFDLNGFVNRMSNPGHKVNTEELSALAEILTTATKYPSKRKLSSMAEDLYKMIAGPTKEQLRGQQGFLFDVGSLGFDL